MKEFVLPHRHGNQPNADMLHRELMNLPHFNAASELFRQLSDSTRVRLFWLLTHREACVINIAAMLEMSSPAISHHLRSLTESGLLTSRRDGKEVYYRAADTQTVRLLHEITEQVMEITCPEKTEDPRTSREETIRRVHDYLVEHLSERITIDELSHLFFLNTTTLKNEFKKQYGTSLAAHLKEHRMERAAELLKNSNTDVAAIARAVGYESQSRFTAAFKETYGQLPTEYRRNGTP